MQYMRIRQLVYGVLLAAMLTSCGGDEEKPPENYAFTSESLPAIGAGETIEGRTCTEQTDEETGALSYVYGGLESAGETVETYVNTLVSEYDCSVIDESGVKQQQTPDYTQDEGTVTVGKENENQDGILKLDIAWESGSCTVTPSVAEGVSITEAPMESLTVEEAIAQMERYTPAQLGLSGSSMEEYHVYAEDGYSMVDDTACFCMNLYETSAVGSNNIEGTYLLSVDGQKLYKLDRATNQVTELF